LFGSGPTTNEDTLVCSSTMRPSLAAAIILRGVTYTALNFNPFCDIPPPACNWGLTDLDSDGINLLNNAPVSNLSHIVDPPLIVCCGVLLEVFANGSWAWQPWDSTGYPEFVAYNSPSVATDCTPTSGLELAVLSPL